MADPVRGGCEYPSARYQGEADNLFSQPFSGNTEHPNEPRPLDDDDIVDIPGDGNRNSNLGDLGGRYRDDGHSLCSRTDSRVSTPMSNTPGRSQETMYFDIHFLKALKSEDLTIFENVLEECEMEVRDNIAAWRQITTPIAWDLCWLPDWKADDDPFFQSAERVENMILDVSDMGYEVLGNPDRLHRKVHPPWVIDLIDAGRAEDLPPVDPEAWKCLFWIWGCYRKVCRAWIDEFQTVLQDWDTWTWNNPLQRTEALSLIELLVASREATNPG